MSSLTASAASPAIASAEAIDPEALDALASGIEAGQRRALARGITLVESAHPGHRRQAEALLTRLLPQTGRSVRLGISGVPGVGKSTFIEAFGLAGLGQGNRLAVLAVDPSSKRSGGSVLGDKTRMQELSRHPGAFIRPSPAGSTLGGVARRTREAMLLCEAAGYDVIVVETVGVGQSETAVADMTDMFLLLLLPGGGDDLQGIKKGIVELADLILVNKADGEMAHAAQRSAGDYRNALHLLRPTSPLWRPEVLTCSAQEGRGIDTVWETIARYREALGGIDASGRPVGDLAQRRAAQARAWMWSEIGDSLLENLKQHPAVQARLPLLEQAVIEGREAPGAAARCLIEAFLTSAG